MMNIKKILLIALYLFGFQAYAGTLVLEGDLPAVYAGQSGRGYVHGAVVMDESSGMIESIITNPSEINALKSKSGVKFISLKNGDDFDVIYPGMIDLHNHTKQNNLGVWKEAEGQFANRFEWRAWTNYKKAVSNNMNPWIGYGKAVNCAAFRWSELQAMVVGTTYLQGPSSCVEGYAIHQVESSRAFPQSEKEKVQAPTDLVVPNDMVFVWQTLKPIIDQGKSYEQALAQVINEYCHADKLLGRPFSAADTMSKEGLDVLKDQDKLKEACVKKVPLDQLPDKFVRYIYWVHKSVVSKRLYADEIANGKGSAIIAHLAEGRRDDPYNQKEYEIVQLLGMNKKGVNFVHGVGISDAGLEDMAQKQMGIIWSPFSNLILYNQTLDVQKAMEKGVLLAMGSDWLPTGTKGPLEELKVAYNYIQDQGLSQAITRASGKSSLEEALFAMVTENAAKLINHWQNGADNSKWQNGEDQGGVGTIMPKAMGSLVVTTKIDKSDAFKNIVKEVWEKDVNLVVVDADVKYGNESYVKLVSQNYEDISGNKEFGMSDLQEDQDAPVLFKRTAKPNKEEKFDFLAELSQYITGKAGDGDINGSVKCNFADKKVMVIIDTTSDDRDLVAFQQAASMDLDKYQDIQRLLGAGLMTQSRNRNDPEKGDPDFIVEDFTPLYTCNDDYHSNRVKKLISQDWDKNRPFERFSNTPSRMAEKYQ